MLETFWLLLVIVKFKLYTVVTLVCYEAPELIPTNDHIIGNLLHKISLSFLPTLSVIPVKTLFHEMEFFFFFFGTG
jgi:hypothetical protein